MKKWIIKRGKEYVSSKDGLAEDYTSSIYKAFLYNSRKEANHDIQNEYEEIGKVDVTIKEIK